MKKIILAAFIILVLVQWWVPGKMIWDKEQVVRNGKLFRFETEPVDPADPFRGRYIILNYKADTFKVSNGADFSGKEVYVSFEENAQGFAQIKHVSLTRPVNEQNYVVAKANHYYSGTEVSPLDIDYTFEEFYMEESKAPKAEEDFRRANQNTTGKTYAVVSILNGDAVIVNVYVNDKPLVQ